MSFYLFLAGGLLLANVSLYRAIFAPHALQVRVLDVGKGDATLVRTPDGATLLIDTGPDASILRALGTALPPWQRTIDAVILTNAKKPSAGGLPDVLSRYRVAQRVALAGSRRLTLSDGAYVDVVITQNALAGVYVSENGITRRVR